MLGNQLVRNCAVLGANGYIGSHLVKHLAVMGFSVQAYDLHARTPFQGSEYVSLDVVDEEAWSAFDSSVDFVFVCSGLNGTYDSFNNYSDFLKVNEMGLLNLLDKLRKDKAKPRIVFPSTRLVYKESNDLVTEDSLLEAKTIYAVNKLACERYLHAYYVAFGIPYFVFRIGHPFGNDVKGSRTYGIVGKFLEMAKAGGPVTLYGTGVQKRTFTSIQDICRQMITIALNQKIESTIFNVAGEGLSIRYVADQIALKFGASVMECDWPYEIECVEAGNTVFDSSKINKFLKGNNLVCPFDRWLA